MEAGAELGSSDPTVVEEKSYRGALIKLINLGAKSQFRNNMAELARSPVGSYLARMYK
jgi:hypothetical protein